MFSFVEFGKKNIYITQQCLWSNGRRKMMKKTVEKPAQFSKAKEKKIKSQEVDAIYIG